MIPNTACISLRIKRKRPCMHALTIISALWSNLMVAAFLTWPTLNLSSVVVGALFALLWPFVQMLGCCWYYHWETGNFKSLHDLDRYSDRLPSFPSAVANARVRPPRFFLRSVASHKESRKVIPVEQEVRHATWGNRMRPDGRGGYYLDLVVTGYSTVWETVTHAHSPWDRVDRGGGNFAVQPVCGIGQRFGTTQTEFRTVDEFDRKTEIPYQSWEECARPAPIPRGTAACVHFNIRYEIDAVLRQRCDEMRPTMLDEARQHDTDVRVDEYGETNGAGQDIHAGVKMEVIAMLSDRCGICSAKLLWWICNFIGYQPVFEYFALYDYTPVNVECHKRMPARSDLRCTYLGNDEEARGIAIDRTGLDFQGNQDSSSPGLHDRLI
jgi:hypothetical protein